MSRLLECSTSVVYVNFSNAIESRMSETMLNEMSSLLKCIPMVVYVRNRMSSDLCSIIKPVTLMRLFCEKIYVVLCGASTGDSFRLQLIYNSSDTRSQNQCVIFDYVNHITFRDSAILKYQSVFSVSEVVANAGVA